MEIDLTKIMIDNTTSAKDAGGVQFVNWVLSTVSKSGINNPTTNELNMLALQYPGRSLDDGQKIELIQKMQKAGIAV